MIKYCGNCGQGYELGTGIHICDLPRTILRTVKRTGPVALICPHCNKEIMVKLEVR